MKIVLKNIWMLLLLIGISSCDDFFITNPDDIYSTDDYPSNFNELYAGYIGITTKFQEVGDQAIFLTDLRGDVLEPSENGTLEMIDIYNYSNLQGNSLADPRGYYAMIITCNDFIQKAFQYREEYPGGINETHFEGLIGGALRYKVWAYFMLGKIYGKAIYFDEPIVGMEDLSKYPVYNLDQIIKKCLELIEVGVNGIDGSKEITWSQILAPDNPTIGTLDYWQYVTPRYEVLLAELLLWDEQYERVYNLILPILNAKAIESASYGLTLNSQNNTNRYSNLFSGVGTAVSSNYIISAIIYDGVNGQTNRLMTYFEDIYPNEFRVRASEYALERYQIQERNDGNDAGDRVRGQFITTSTRKVNKYYSANTGNRSPYESDSFINLWRAHDLHFMLIEALNHMGNWTASSVLLNEGMGRYDSQRNFLTDTTSVFYGFTGNWVSSSANLGVRGFAGLVERDIPDADEKYDWDPERIKAYDLAMLDEMLLEYLAEGKSYPQMIKMARRYNDWSIVADRVVPKYPEERQEEIRQKIMNGAYFVEWDLYAQ